MTTTVTCAELHLKTKYLRVSRGKSEARVELRQSETGQERADARGRVGCEAEARAGLGESERGGRKGGNCARGEGLYRRERL